VFLDQLRAAMASIHARWGHGHDGLTPGCTLCADERAEVAALIAVDQAAGSVTETTRTAPPIR
jgi:hypothetical protein